MDGDVQISSSLVNNEVDNRVLMDERAQMELKEQEKKDRAREACNELISRFVKEAKTYNNHALLHNIISD